MAKDLHFIKFVQRYPFLVKKRSILLLINGKIRIFEAKNEGSDQREINTKGASHLYWIELFSRRAF
jgi:hypothetical protein